MSKPFTTETLGIIGKYILEGMSENEASILADTTLEILNEHKENNEEIRNYIEKCKVNFKYNHIVAMQAKRSEKISQWLLERLRPEDFNLSNRSRTSTTINVIGTIIQQIQGDDTNRLIARNRQDRLELASESNGDDPRPERVIEILN